MHRHMRACAGYAGSSAYGSSSEEPRSGGRGTAGGARVHAKGATAASPSQPMKKRSFDPLREVAAVAGTLSGEGNKLVLLEMIGKGGFGTGGWLRRLWGRCLGRATSWCFWSLFERRLRNMWVVAAVMVTPSEEGNKLVLLEPIGIDKESAPCTTSSSHPHLYHTSQPL